MVTSYHLEIAHSGHGSISYLAGLCFSFVIGC
jgi:hypothetical protein